MVHSIEQHAIDMAKKLRCENHLKLRDLAEILNTSCAFIGNVESRKSNAKYNLKHINILAEYFGISPKLFVPDEPTNGK